MRAGTFLGLLICAASMWAATGETPAVKPAKKSKGAAESPLPPKAGVKTPGVQLAATTLKFENEYAFSPDWLIATTSVFAPNPGKNEVERIDTKTFAAGEAIAGVTKPCGGAVSAFKDLWTVSCSEQALLRLDAKTGKQIAKIATGVSPAAGVLAATADSVWLLTDSHTTLARIDPAENKIVAEIRLPAACQSLITGEGALWVACPEDDRVLRIDPLTNLVDKRIETAPQPVAVALGEGALWVLSKKDGKLERVDTKTYKVVKTIELSIPNAVSGLVIAQGSVWVTAAGFPLTRIDPTVEKERVAQQFWGDGGGAIYFASNSLWLSNSKQGTLWRLDPKRVLAILPD